jgi:hypothetical protein
MYFRLLPSWRTTTTTIVVYRIRALETVLLAPSGMRGPVVTSYRQVLLRTATSRCETSYVSHDRKPFSSTGENSWIPLSSVIRKQAPWVAVDLSS